jgi:hypothetical protein
MCILSGSFLMRFRWVENAAVNGLTSSHIRLFSLSCTCSHILSVAKVLLAQTSPLFNEV